MMHKERILHLGKMAGMRTLAHAHTHTHMQGKISIKHNQLGRRKNTDSYPKQSRRADGLQRAVKTTSTSTDGP